MNYILIFVMCELTLSELVKNVFDCILNFLYTHKIHHLAKYLAKTMYLEAGAKPCSK